MPEANAGALHVIIMHEPDHACMSAGCIDLPDFLLLAPTREALEAQLPEALATYCGGPVAYRILTPR